MLKSNKVFVVTFEGKAFLGNEREGLKMLIPLYRRLDLSCSCIFPDLVYHKQVVPGIMWFMEYKAQDNSSSSLKHRNYGRGKAVRKIKIRHFILLVIQLNNTMWNSTIYWNAYYQFRSCNNWVSNVLINFDEILIGR